MLVIEGRSAAEIEQEARRSWEEITVSGHLEMYLAEGMDRKEAMKAVAKDRGVSKREIYSALLDEEMN